MSIFKLCKAYKSYILFVVIGVAGLYIYTNHSDVEEVEDTTAFYVVETISRGDVSSGIETTGEIIAAQKLDLDVYKQTEQIEAVSIVNGQHVEAGDVLISFDKSDAYVDTQSSKASVAEAALSLETAEINASDPNTEIQTKENQLVGYQKTITDAEQDIKDAYRDYLNKNIETVSLNRATESKIPPGISGVYTSGIEDTYRIQIDVPDYNDRLFVESGYIYNVFDSSGKIDEQEVIFNTATPVGDTGLRITFTNSELPEEGDKWEIVVPNKNISEFEINYQSYQEELADLEKIISDTHVTIDALEQELQDLREVDTGSYRDLTVEKAEANLAEAQQRLYENYDIVQDRDIVAPFSGTVEGMSNVVEGATPTGGSEDTIDLGTLISDEFLATFSLGAVDVAKVEVGQKVAVTVTSFANVDPLTAYVTEISSLPNDSGVAQYNVQALIEIPEGLGVELREGLLADIEVVQEEVVDVIRIPSSALNYVQRQAQVSVLDGVTEEQAQSIARLGIVRSDDGTITSYPVDVQIGLNGSFYVEIISGITEGQYIVVSSNESTSTEAEESVVQQQGVRGTGGGGGGQRPGQ